MLKKYSQNSNGKLKDKEKSGSLTVSPMPSDTFMDRFKLILHPVPTVKLEERELPVSYVEVLLRVYLLPGEYETETPKFKEA